MSVGLRMHGWTDGRMHGWTDGRMEGWTVGWTVGWTDGWMDAPAPKPESGHCGAMLSGTKWHVEKVSGNMASRLSRC